VTNLGMKTHHDRGQRRRLRKRRGSGYVAVLIALGILVGGGYIAYTLGLEALKERFGPAADYAGPGNGSVVVEVAEGDTAADIGRTLLRHDVVKSQEAFTEAAVADPASQGIQVGFYEMKKQMSAEDALAILVKPENKIEAALGFREGLTVDQIVRQLAKKTDFTARQYRKVLRKPRSLGLPAYAKGNPEGYLFPATYQVPPNATPRVILTMMVDRFKQAARSTNLEAKAEKLGISPHDAVTVASLVQAEARFDQDFPKVARVIYNRLDEPMRLQFDSTVHYAVGKDGGVGTSDSDRDVDSPYNTYKNQGLPPTPIMAPGEQALEAALDPADGPWLFFVTTNPDSGETKFAESYQQHLENKAEFDAWCAGSDNC
jgi:UPF0755 protein